MVARKKSEADWAVDILIKKQEPMYYADLVSEIVKKMGKKRDAEVMTSVYTRLNLDNRLIYQGDGYWFYDANRIKQEG